jgi:hypothetical protein
MDPIFPSRRLGDAGQIGTLGEVPDMAPIPARSGSAESWLFSRPSRGRTRGGTRGLPLPLAQAAAGKFAGRGPPTPRRHPWADGRGGLTGSRTRLRIRMKLRRGARRDDGGPACSQAGRTGPGGCLRVVAEVGGTEAPRTQLSSRISHSLGSLAPQTVAARTRRIHVPLLRGRATSHMHSGPEYSGRQLAMGEKHPPDTAESLPSRVYSISAVESPQLTAASHRT